MDDMSASSLHSPGKVGDSEKVLRRATIRFSSFSNRHWIRRRQKNKVHKLMNSYPPKGGL